MLARPCIKSKVCKVYMNVQGWKRVSNGSRLANGTQMPMVGEGYLNVQGWQRIPTDPMLTKGIKRCKAGKVQGRQNVHKGPRFAKGT